MVFFCPFRRVPALPRKTPRGAKRAGPRAGLPAVSAKVRSAPFGGKIRCRKTVAELGMTNLAITRGFDHGPSVGVGKQGLEHQRIEPVTSPAGAKGPEDRCAGKRKIADRVERLVAHELVGEAQAFAVDDAVVADRHGVLERSAERETGGPQVLHILHEAEGAGASKLAAESARIYVDLDLLIADQRRIELDFDV